MRQLTAEWQPIAVSEPGILGKWHEMPDAPLGIERASQLLMQGRILLAQRRAGDGFELMAKPTSTMRRGPTGELEPIAHDASWRTLLATVNQ